MMPDHHDYELPLAAGIAELSNRQSMAEQLPPPGLTLITN